MINYIGSILFRAALNNDEETINALIRNEASSSNEQEYRAVAVIQMVYQAWQLRTFITTIRAQGYDIQDVTRDGNCFFEAVAQQLNAQGEHTTHDWLRQNAVGYMQRNLNDFQAFIYPNYMHEMSQLNTPADEPIIRALSAAVGININIHNTDGSITPISHEGSVRVIEIGYTGGHYVVLTPNQDNLELQILGGLGLLGGGHS